MRGASGVGGLARFRHGEERAPGDGRSHAGYSMMGAVEDTTVEEAKAQLETNFFGVLRVCRAALPALRAGNGGYIVSISSLAGIVGLPFSGL